MAKGYNYTGTTSQLMKKLYSFANGVNKPVKKAYSFSGGVNTLVWMAKKVFPDYSNYQVYEEGQYREVYTPEYDASEFDTFSFHYKGYGTMWACNYGNGMHMNIIIWVRTGDTVLDKVSFSTPDVYSSGQEATKEGDMSITIGHLSADQKKHITLRIAMEAKNIDETKQIRGGIDITNIVAK